MSEPIVLDASAAPLIDILIEMDAAQEARDAAEPAA